MITTRNDAPFKSAVPAKLQTDSAQHGNWYGAGGGITGMTAAVLLQRSGKKVIVADSGTCGGGETAYSSAQLTEILDTRYYELIESFGEAIFV